uniref:DUF834 domain-containing protein n=1 Tax=Oryza sativa subsp. japonica TaxID=39947 RepID=Q8H8F1_ORYSJ|nr:hypothetical protein [Oryza sativa Japonica Group]
MEFRTNLWRGRVGLRIDGGKYHRRTRGRGRLTAGPHLAAAGRARRRPRRHGRREAAHPRPDGRRRRPTARRSGTRERGGKGEANGAVHGSPRSTATTGTATETEEGGGAARDDEDDGVPAVGERNGGADGVGDDAAKPKEATPSREEVRSDDGGEPELGGRDSGGIGIGIGGEGSDGGRIESGGGGGDGERERAGRGEPTLKV